MFLSKGYLFITNFSLWWWKTAIFSPLYLDKVKLYSCIHLRSKISPTGVILYIRPYYRDSFFLEIHKKKGRNHDWSCFCMSVPHHIFFGSHQSVFSAVSCLQSLPTVHTRG